jgi:hypothetical protein
LANSTADQYDATNGKFHSWPHVMGHQQASAQTILYKLPPGYVCRKHKWILFLDLGPNLNVANYVYADFPKSEEIQCLVPSILDKGYLTCTNDEYISDLWLMASRFVVSLGIALLQYTLGTMFVRSLWKRTTYWERWDLCLAEVNWLATLKRPFVFLMQIRSLFRSVWI